MISAVCDLEEIVAVECRWWISRQYAPVVPLRVVGDLVGGTVHLAWRKLRP
jgi:hypothetical protein